MSKAMIRFGLPEWVRLIPIGDAGTAERELTDLLAGSQEQGDVGMADYEMAANEVIEGAVEQGIWALGLVTPPGRAAALLSVTGFELPVTLNRHSTTDLLSHLEARGGPGIASLRFADLAWGQTALLLYRTDPSGAQAQALLPDANGTGCLVFTLAAGQRDRGPELLELLSEIVTRAHTD